MLTSNISVPGSQLNVSQCPQSNFCFSHTSPTSWATWASCIFKSVYFRINLEIFSDPPRPDIYVQIWLGDIVTLPRGCQGGSSQPLYLQMKRKVPTSEWWGFHISEEIVLCQWEQLSEILTVILCLKYPKMTKMKANSHHYSKYRSYRHAHLLFLS